MLESKEILRTHPF